MGDYQFKNISHCLRIFNPESFHFSAPTLHMIEWKGYWKEVCFYWTVLKTFRAPHLEEALELMTLPRTVVLIAKYYLCSQSFSSTLVWVTAVFFQKKQRALRKALKKYIFARAAWTDNSEDLMINALIGNSSISGSCLLMSALLNLIGETFWNSGKIPEKLSSYHFRQ